MSKVPKLDRDPSSDPNPVLPPQAPGLLLERPLRTLAWIVVLKA